MGIRIPGALLIPVLAMGGAHAGFAEPPDRELRVAPLPPEEWSPETRATLEGTVRRVAGLVEREQAPAKPLPILTVIARHPTLLGPFIEFTGTLATRGVLSRRDSELLALRTAWSCGSEFEWGHHVLYARAAGIGDAEIARTASREIGPEWSPRERALLAAADELHARQHLSDATWAALARDFDEPQRIEIPFIVGQYTMLSMVAESLGVPVEAELPKLPEAAR
jgi:4-carboxymuconolactone decarboxylase